MPDALIFCEFPTVSGGENSLLVTLPALNAAGWRTSIAAPLAGALADSLRRQRIRHIAFDVRDRAGRRRPLPEIRAAIHEIIKKERPALVHANSLSMGRIIGPLAKYLVIPSICHLRDIVRMSGQAIRDLNCNSLLLAVSNTVRDFHVAQGVNGSICNVLYNGVDLKKFQPRGRTGWLHRELEIRRDFQLAASVGQIGPRKGTDLLLSAAKALASGYAQLHWVIVGSRYSGKKESVEFEASLMRASRTYPVDGRIHFLGSRHDVPRILNEIDLLVHPARQEPLGRVLLEAAASGTPIVTTNVGGTGEIFEGQRCGAYLVPPDDADALTAAIEDVLNSKPLQESLSRTGRRIMERSFSSAIAAEGLLNHYHDVWKAATGAAAEKPFLAME